MAEHVEIDEPDRPRKFGRMVGGLIRELETGRHLALRGRTVDIEEIIVELAGRTGLTIDIDPDRHRLDMSALVAPDLGAAFGPPSSMAAAPGCQRDLFLEDRCPVDVEHRAANHPRHRVDQPGVGGIVPSDILQVAHSGVEAAAAGRVDLGESNPTGVLENPSCGRFRRDFSGSRLRHGVDRSNFGRFRS